MDIAVQAPAFIRAIAPYQPGQSIDALAQQYDLETQNIVKLASNENPLGMSERACAAAQAAVLDAARYPDANGTALKHAISQRFGVDAAQIVLGNGSNDVLELVAHTFLMQGYSAVMSQYGFIVYALATQASGARQISVPARDYGHDLDAMLAAIDASTRVLFIANPNNPTGTFIDGDSLLAFLTKVPAHVLVVLDEAYTEYLDATQAYHSFSWLSRFPNLLVVRTFSKAYGLAGLRVGYGVGAREVVELMNRVRQPFNVNHVAQAAACAALHDHDFIARTTAVNRQGKALFYEALKALKIPYVPSSGNFVMADFSGATHSAAQVHQQCLQPAGVIVRPLAGYGLGQWLRLSIGLPDENLRMLQQLRTYLTGRDDRWDLLDQVAE